MSTAPENPAPVEGVGAGIDVGRIEVLARATWESEGRPSGEWLTTTPKERDLYRRMARLMLAGEP